jgi:hypothetical protein
LLENNKNLEQLLDDKSKKELNDYLNGERFSDFVIKAGYFKEVLAGIDFHS